MAVDQTLVHTSLVPIRWGDMDAFGHVNNVHYFRYMEQTRVELMEKLGFMRPGESVFVIVNAACSYAHPLVYPGTVEVEMYAGEPGRSSVETSYELRRRERDERDPPGLLYASGRAKVIWIDAATGKSAPLPDALRRALARISEGS